MKNARSTISPESPGRVWTYPKGGWSGHLPMLGGDEYGRRTLVLPIPFGPTVVVALYTCHCEDCEYMRAQMMEWVEAEEALRDLALKKVLADFHVEMCRRVVEHFDDVTLRFNDDEPETEDLYIDAIDQIRQIMSEDYEFPEFQQKS